MAKGEKKPEAQLLAEVTAAIEQVDEARRARFVAAVSTYFGLTTPTIARNEAAGEGPPDGQPKRTPRSPTENSDSEEVFEAFEDLYDRCNPSKQSEKALVGGYWYQVVKSQPTFTGQEVNATLKNVGHGIGNITDCFTDLQELSPALARQVAKSGKARQARKKYKLTTAGITRVKQLMAGTRDGDE